MCILCEQQQLCAAERFPGIDNAANAVDEYLDGFDDVAQCLGVCSLVVVFENLSDCDTLRLCEYSHTGLNRSTAYIFFHSPVESLDQGTVLRGYLLDSEIKLQEIVLPWIETRISHGEPTASWRVQFVA
jgi:hypothetical protein